MKNRKLLLLAIPLLILLIGAVVFKPKTSQNLAADINFNDTVEEGLNTMYIIHDTLLEDKEIELKIFDAESGEEVYEESSFSKRILKINQNLNAGDYRIKLQFESGAYESHFYLKHDEFPVILVRPSKVQGVSVPAHYFENDSDSLSMFLPAFSLLHDLPEDMIIAGKDLPWPFPPKNGNFSIQEMLPDTAHTFSAVLDYLYESLTSESCKYQPMAYYFSKDSQTVIMACMLEYLYEKDSPHPEHRHNFDTISAYDRTNPENYGILRWLESLFIENNQKFRTYLIVVSTKAISLDQKVSGSGPFHMLGTSLGAKKNRDKGFEKEARFAEVFFYDYIREVQDSNKIKPSTKLTSEFEHFSECIKCKK